MIINSERLCETCRFHLPERIHVMTLPFGWGDLYKVNEDRCELKSKKRPCDKHEFITNV